MAYVFFCSFSFSFSCKNIFVFFFVVVGIQLSTIVMSLRFEKKKNNFTVFIQKQHSLVLFCYFIYSNIYKRWLCALDWISGPFHYEYRWPQIRTMKVIKLNSKYEKSIIFCSSFSSTQKKNPKQFLALGSNLPIHCLQCSWIYRGQTCKWAKCVVKFCQYFCIYSVHSIQFIWLFIQ